LEEGASTGNPFIPEFDHESRPALPLNANGAPELVYQHSDKLHAEPG